MVKVYTKSNCQPCKATKRFLDKNNIPYIEESLEDASVLESMKSMGFTSAPIVISGEESWSGFNPTKLKTLMA